MGLWLGQYSLFYGFSQFFHPAFFILNFPEDMFQVNLFV